VTEEIFSDLNIGRFFDQVRWKVGSEKDHKIAFDNLFLEKKRKKANPQNFKSCPFYKMWNHFREHHSEEVVEEARKLLRKRFRKKMFWFPWVKNDRIWTSLGTPKIRDLKLSPGLQAGIPAPLLLTRGNLRWNPEQRQVSFPLDTKSEILK
jgi:hypothetical protein